MFFLRDLSSKMNLKGLLSPKDILKSIKLRPKCCHFKVKLFVYILQPTFHAHIKADSHYTANLLRPAIDGCKIENFPNFRSDLQRPSPLRQSQRPATSVNEP